MRTDELRRRTARAPSLTAENAAYYRLSNALLQPPLEQLQVLLECALTLCNADTAGISLLEESDGVTQFRWVALAGRYRHAVGGVTPREASPCGVTLDRGAPQLFEEPGRHFACLAAANPPILEGLVLPIKGVARDPGTIWVATHVRKTEFDMQDVRVMSGLAGFASFACHQLVAARLADALVSGPN